MEGEEFTSSIVTFKSETFITWNQIQCLEILGCPTKKIRNILHTRDNSTFKYRKWVKKRKKKEEEKTSCTVASQKSNKTKRPIFWIMPRLFLLFGRNKSFLCTFNRTNPAYVKHWISQPIQIVAPLALKKIRFFLFLFGG